MMRIRLLGQFAIEDAGHSVPLALGPAGRRLAAYLFAFPNRAHRRDKLIDLFWTDAAEGPGRAAFSTTLWKLRRMIAPDTGALGLTASTREVRLDVADSRLVDAHHFRAALLAAVGSEGAPDCGAMDDATSLYTGPFLEEYDEDWVLDQRERLHSLYIRALGHLMARFAREAQYENSLLCGRRILASDGMRENVQRAVMLLYVLTGQRGEAIRQFARCCHALRSECDVEPMPETRALGAAIRSDDLFAELPRLAAAQFAAASSEDWPPTAFL